LAIIHAYPGFGFPANLHFTLWAQLRAEGSWTSSPLNCVNTVFS